MNRSKKIMLSLIALVVVVLGGYFLTNPISKPEQNTHMNNISNESLLKDYRSINHEYFNSLGNVVYNSTTYSNGKEDREYVFKDINYNNLDDSDYYYAIKSMFSLAHQGLIDKELDKKQINELDKKVSQLEKQVEEKRIKIR